MLRYKCLCELRSTEQVSTFIKLQTSNAVSRHELLGVEGKQKKHFINLKTATKRLIIPTLLYLLGKTFVL